MQYEALRVLTFDLTVWAHFHTFILLVHLRYNGRAVHLRVLNRAQTFTFQFTMTVHLFSPQILQFA